LFSAVLQRGFWRRFCALREVRYRANVTGLIARLREFSKSAS
jgi:hypothetical protein